MLLATSNPKKPCGISYSDKGDFPFQTQLWHHTGHLMVGLLPFNVSRMTRCDVHDNDNGPTHTPPLHTVTPPPRMPLSHALTRPHMPSHTLLTSHTISIAVTVVCPLPCLRPCMPSHILPTSHPVTVTIACPCTPSRLCKPSPSMSSHLACPLTFAHHHPCTPSYPCHLTPGPMLRLATRIP